MELFVIRFDDGTFLKMGDEKIACTLIEEAFFFNSLEDATDYLSFMDDPCDVISLTLAIIKTEVLC